MTWPRQDVLEFGPMPGAVPCARLHARLVLAEWGLARLAEPAEIIVSCSGTASSTAARALPVRPSWWQWLPGTASCGWRSLTGVVPECRSCALLLGRRKAAGGFSLCVRLSARWGWHRDSGQTVTWFELRHG